MCFWGTNPFSARSQKQGYHAGQGHPINLKRCLIKANFCLGVSALIRSFSDNNLNPEIILSPLDLSALVCIYRGNLDPLTNVLEQDGFTIFNACCKRVLSASASTANTRRRMGALEREAGEIVSRR